MQAEKTRPAVKGPPDEAALRDAALRHLAQYTATEAGLMRVLQRRIDRWAREAGAEVSDAAAIRQQASACVQVARQIVAGLVNVRAVDDAAFAQARAGSLLRAGRSRRAVEVALAAKGVPVDMARQAAVRDEADDLTAAVILARKRRLGPFRRTEATEAEDHRRALGVLARAGFSRDIAERALGLGLDEAEALIRDQAR